MDHMQFAGLALDFCVGTIYGKGYSLLFPMGVQVLILSYVLIDEQIIR